MPPKRKAAGKAAATKAKKAKQAAEEVKVEEEAAPETMKDKIAKLKAADKGKPKKHKPDTFCHLSSSSEVHEDFDAMLNQTNIGHNNNKYYVIQVLNCGKSYYAWNRWGRVGETGQNALKGPFSSPEPAIKDFEKKFRDKTGNAWSARDNFTPKPKKYTLLEMAGEEDDGEDVVDMGPSDSGVPKKVLPSKLNKETQALMKLIFDNDMFRDALKKFDIDVKKMPLGKLSKTQIAKGFEALEEIEEAINSNKPKNSLNALSSKFYTAIPHDFGRRVPPAISTAEEVQKKYDMLAVLGDIEMAQSIQKDKEKAEKESKEDTVPHPLDTNYGLLNCTLDHVDKSSKQYKLLEKYFLATEGSSWRKMKLKEIWEVDRASEGPRFAANNKIDYRKLLWHGTNVAVVTAILKTGLRIMPHSGGRVGRGIYFASENNKSAGYVSSAQGKGIMFLNEVALGSQHRITRDDSSLVQAPSGYDSVLACGQQEPDEKSEVTIKLDGKNVVVPQGKPQKVSKYSSSSFWQSEYLVYREDQCRIRYLLLFDM
ncbi:protein mono-ADP-ribosyltransferase PARP3 [Aplysia californica]|uniref:Poly [ADP-ribose] polymerase n=1 Tax=Aplysia californica TaxID=6500 RepID=A0ABM0JSM9_APLCA|nr:protein mono-ADP-ribosyltransferase PARP3 [Aplysia californica]